MSDEDASARAAGRSILIAYQHLRSCFEQVALLLQAADELLAAEPEPWECDHRRVVWGTSAELDRPQDWIPSRVVRLWRRPAARAWTSALALQLFLRDDREPELGGFLLAPLAGAPLAVWSPTWCDHEPYDARWLPGAEGRAFDWSEPRPGSDLPVRARGRYVPLTDIASLEELAARLLGPLRAAP